MTAVSPTYLDSLGGGMLIGLSSAILLLLNGKIAGISGIVASLFSASHRSLVVNTAFVLGLIAGPILFHGMFGAWPVVHIPSSWTLLAVAGVLVGFGTRLGSGCTSGHGVSGLARLSPRSMVAVAVFLIVAVVTVLIKRMGGWI
jgi:uncharacterized membrane protein YedE/YeeE